MLRRTRAALIIAALWVLCWVPLGLALEETLVRIFLPSGPRIDSPYLGVTIWAIWGALSGLGFAIILGFLERGHAVPSLSTFRVLSWGAVGSALVPMLFYAWAYAYEVVRSGPQPAPSSTLWLVMLTTAGISAFLGIICAAITMALMRGGSAGQLH